MNHEYTAEQLAYNGGLVDKFVEFTGPTDKGCTDVAHKKLVMGYYDGIQLQDFGIMHNILQ